jgi:intracellular sulfur oxidation DsrE/DsrF family protein
MDRRQSLRVGLTSLATLAFGRQTLGQEQPGRRMHHLVLDVSGASREHWEVVLRNIENVRRAFGEQNVQVQVVAHGSALSFLELSNEEAMDRLRGLHTGGVRFAVCENSMRQQRVTPETLIPFVEVVDSGIAELVRKQEAGWAYVKADT